MDLAALSRFTSLEFSANISQNFPSGMLQKLYQDSRDCKKLLNMARLEHWRPSGNTWVKYRVAHKRLRNVKDRKNVKEEN